MTGNILELITEQYHSLTRSSRKLADYILANTHDSQYMSISSLAENCGVSEASITRFCRSLGLSGYNNLKLALAKAAYVTDIGDPSDTPETITSEDTLNSIFHKLYDSNVLSLNETMELLDETEISRAVDLISSADRVFCLGNGGSMVMAMEAWARFSIATSRFVHIEDSHMQVMNISSPRNTMSSCSSPTPAPPRTWRISCASLWNGMSPLCWSHIFQIRALPNTRMSSFCVVTTKARCSPVLLPPRSASFLS